MAFPELVSRHVVPRFLYLPGRSLTPGTPAAAGLDHGEERWITTEDGVELHAWWVPARRGAGRRDARARDSTPTVDGEGCGTVVYFHGNAGTLADRAFLAETLSRSGFGVLLVDYRGYGRSGGVPGEEGLHRDARAAHRHARTDLGVPATRLALAGHSLGSAVAARAAAELPAGAVVLTGAFPSVPELARHAYPYLPAPLFRGWTTNRYDVLASVRRLEAPLLVARGELDTLVPREQTRSVFEEASGPRRWYEGPGAGHDDLWDHEGFLSALRSFLTTHLDCGDGGG